MNETKENILKTAFRLFLRKTYKEVTMKEILKKSNIAKGTFYYYFESKELLFREVIERYFYNAMFTDFSRYSQLSLYAFYHDYLDDQAAIVSLYFKTYLKNSGAPADLNYFYLWFDALKIIPGFPQKMEEMRNREIAAWTAVIANAVRKGEIVSKAGEERIAKCFHLIEQGLSMELVMEGRTPDWKNELTVLWDNFYEELKPNGSRM